MALETSPESPAPLRVISQAIAGWVGRLGAAWIEGQVTQLNLRPGADQVFLQVRDVQEDSCLTVVTSRAVVSAVEPPLADGARVVIYAKPEFWFRRGTLQLRAQVIRTVGLGELLARLEQLKAELAAEGLFAAQRKRALPFLPRRIGLVCGRASAAERDVIENARRRWPAIDFEVRPVAVQGPRAVAEVVAAVRELDAAAEVDVIVIARGGGSVEDLLPFSAEILIRTVSAASTPVVSAIGHEQDAPLLDFVADVRASTPTDAARRVVPDFAEQLNLVSQLRGRGHRAADRQLSNEQQRLDALRRRPALADPGRLIRDAEAELAAARVRVRRLLAQRLGSASEDLGHLSARLRALSPAATLDRGYAIVRTADGAIVRSAEQVRGKQAAVHVRVAHGEFDAVPVAFGHAS